MSAAGRGRDMPNGPLGSFRMETGLLAEMTLASPLF